LPLVEPNDETKSEVAGIVIDACRDYSDLMIGRLGTRARVDCRALAR